MPITCTALEGIVKSCDNNSGGIYGVWITPHDNVASITENITWPNYEITNVTLAGPPSVLFENYFVRRNTSNYTEEMAADLVNGSSFVTQTINLVFHRREAAKSNSLKILASGQQYLDVVVLDANGRYWYFPYMQMTASGEGSGTARADGSRYTVTLVAENEFTALELLPELPQTYATLGIV